VGVDLGGGGDVYIEYGVIVLASGVNSRYCYLNNHPWYLEMLQRGPASHLLLNWRHPQSHRLDLAVLAYSQGSRRQAPVV
jgi:hypothetical protein